MELLVLIGMLLLGAVVLLPIISFIMVLGAREDIALLKEELRKMNAGAAPAAAQKQAQQPPLQTAMQSAGEPKTEAPVIPAPAIPQTQMSAPSEPPKEKPVSPVMQGLMQAPAPAAKPALVMPAKVSAEPKIIEHTPIAPVNAASPAQPAETSYISNMTAADWFSWIGGFALFLGVVFAVKYSIDNNLISPAIRFILGLVFGTALTAGAFLIKSDKHKVTSDTLCGAGLAVMYASIFSAAYFYTLLAPLTAFVMMGGVALLSFALAVAKNSPYIGYLGVITGFLTPVLMNTGSQNYLGLFAYLALINAGAMSAGLKKGWDHLTITALSFTLLFQFVWFAPQFRADKINDFCIIFAAYTLAAAGIAYFLKEKISIMLKQSLALYILGSFLFLFLTDFGIKPILLAFFINALMAGLFWSEPKKYATVFNITGVAAFLLLLAWTGTFAAAGSKTMLLAGTLLFTLLNAGVALLKHKEADGNLLSNAFPAAALICIMIIGGSGLSYFFAFLLVLTSLMSAAATKNYKFMYPVLGLFAIMLLINIFSGSPSIKLYEVICASVMAPLMLGAVSLAGRFIPGSVNASDKTGLAVASCAMPYLVMLAAFVQAGVESPVTIYSFALAVTVLILAFAWKTKNSAAVITALVGAGLSFVSYNTGEGFFAVTAAFNIALVALFFIYPYTYQKRDENDTIPWLCSGLAGAAVLFLFYKLFLLLPEQTSYLNMSSVSAAAAVIYMFAAYFMFDSQKMKDIAFRKNLSYIGGLALAALTVFLCNEFSNEWLTLALTLEAGCLMWLFDKLQIGWTRNAGALMLAAVFIRLILNPYILGYHDSGAKIVNWFLLVYGSAAVVLYYAGYIVNKHKDESAESLNLSGILYAGAWLVLFALINIEIADYFSTPGARLEFNILGNFAQTVTYTLAWGIYGMLTMFAGLKSTNTRIVGIMLVAAAILKLFMVDVWMLETLHRIIAFIGMAVILIAGSFVYQSMLKTVKK